MVAASPSKPAQKRRRVEGDRNGNAPLNSSPLKKAITPYRNIDDGDGVDELQSPSSRRGQSSARVAASAGADLSLSSQLFSSALNQSAKKGRGRPPKSATSTPVTKKRRLQKDDTSSGDPFGSIRRDKYQQSPSSLDISIDDQDNVFFSRPTPGSVRPPKPATPATPVAAAPLDADSAMPVIRKHILAKLAQRSPIALHGLAEQFNTLYQVAEQAVASGESNTIVVTGPRGSGKTALVNSVLQQLTCEYGESFYTVRLDGFVHTDDKLALREIWRQLGRELEPEDEQSDGLSGSYADTMAKLLATLAHPDEQGVAGGTNDVEATSRSIIFVMSEFDRFTTHPRQTLLYNLFDIAQSRKAPIAVLGLTTRVSLVDSFEKRVKSRFSHRYVHVTPPNTVPMAADICRAALTVSPDELSVADRVEISGDWQQPLAWWATCVDALLTSQPFLMRYIHPIFYRTKSMSGIFNSLILPMSTITQLPDTTAELVRHIVYNPLLSLTTDITGRSILAPPDSKLSALASLSDVQLALLIAACRIDAIHNASACNFNMAYWEYVRLASQAKVASSVSGLVAVGAGASTRVWGRDAAHSAWEALAAGGLLVPVLGGAAAIAKGTITAADGLGVGLLRPDIGLEEIPDYVPDIDRLFERWCRRI